MVCLEYHSIRICHQSYPDAADGYICVAHGVDDLRQPPDVTDGREVDERSLHQRDGFIVARTRSRHISENVAGSMRPPTVTRFPNHSRPLLSLGQPPRRGPYEIRYHGLRSARQRGHSHGPHGPLPSSTSSPTRPPSPVTGAKRYRPPWIVWTRSSAKTRRDSRYPSVPTTTTTCTTPLGHHLRELPLRLPPHTFGADRLIWATDYPYIPFDTCTADLLLNYPISDEEKHLIAHDNAERLLGL